MQTEALPSPLVVGLGEILWDCLPTGRCLGGAPANFAFHAHALGARARVVSAVGDDEAGCAIRVRLRELGLSDDCFATDPVHPTGLVDVCLDEKGTPGYVIRENAAWDFLSLSEESLSCLRQADAVCFGSLAQRCAVSRATIYECLSHTRPDCLRVFDINLRQSYYDRDVVHASLQWANAFKLNDEELPVVAALLGMAGGEDGILRELFVRYDLHFIALTRGAKGSVLQTRSDRSLVAGAAVAVVDSVGAGDSFAAAVTIGWLRGMPLDRINECASRLATFVCTRAGATPNLPDDLRALFS